MLYLLLLALLTAPSLQPLSLPTEFNWFPGGDYNSISYRNYELLESIESYQETRQLQRALAEARGQSNFLPTILDESIIRGANGALLRLDDVSHFANRLSKEEQKSLITSLERALGGEVKGLLPGRAVSISVYRLDLSNDPIENMLSSNILIKHSTFTINDLEVPIYQLKMAGNPNETATWFACIFEDEFVLTKSATVLKAMIEAKFGLRTNLVDSCTDFIETREFFTDLGEVWSAHFPHAETRVQMDTYIRNGADADQVNEQAEQNLRVNYMLNLSRSRMEEEFWTMRAIQVYRNEDEAKEAFQRSSSRQSSIPDLKSSLEGNTISIVAVHTPEYMEYQMNEIREAIEAIKRFRNPEPEKKEKQK